jgi:hypothetical protein
MPLKGLILFGKSSNYSDLVMAAIGFVLRGIIHLSKRRNLKLGANGLFSTSVRPQMVDFDSGQGLNIFETAGIAGYSEDFKKVKTPPWAKRCRLWMGNR